MWGSWVKRMPTYLALVVAVGSVTATAPHFLMLSNNISHMDITFLRPTDYSGLRIGCATIAGTGTGPTLDCWQRMSGCFGVERRPRAGPWGWLLFSQDLLYHLTFQAQFGVELLEAAVFLFQGA